MKVKNLKKDEKEYIFDLELTQVGFEICEPSHHFGPAVRQNFLIHYIRNGKGKYYFKDKVVDVGMNELFLILPDEVTYYQADNDYPWEYYWFGFNGSCSRSLLSEVGFDNKTRKIKYLYNSEFSIDSIITELTNIKMLNKSDKIYELAKLYEIFSWLRKSYEAKSAMKGCSTSGFDILTAAEEYIKRSYMLDITVESIASHIGVDRVMLYRLFKSKYEKSPQQYLIDFRMREAEKLISETGFSIKQVAYSVGYHDQYLFSKMFKKTFGLSPKLYRQVNKITL